jgi:hypothetical protein
MAGWTSWEGTGDAANIIGDCACCGPCGFVCEYGMNATITWSYNYEEETQTTTGSASANPYLGENFVSRTCCPGNYPPIYDNVTQFLSAGQTYAAGETVLDAPVHGQYTITPEVGSPTSTDVRIAGFDIGYFTTHTQARVLIRIGGSTSAYYCDETDPDVYPGEAIKTYVFTNTTPSQETVTLTLGKNGALVEECVPNYESCFEIPPPP